MVQTAPAVEQRGHSQHCDQLEDTEVIAAACNQQTAYGPIVLNVIPGFNTCIYLPIAVPLPTGRDNARIQPFYRLILFPFHGFW